MIFDGMMLQAVPPGLHFLTLILAFVVAVIPHEVAHGYAALWLGDPTAKYMGRLSLNPIKHIDLWGTIILPLALLLSGTGMVFGWAKPVPVNYYNLRNGKYGPFLVALAGPATNFVLLVFFGALTRLSPADTALPFLFTQIAAINAVLMLFNLIPVPPLDGSKVLYLFLEDRPDIIRWLEQYGMFILIGLLLLGGGLLSSFVFGPAVELTQFFTGRLF